MKTLEHNLKASAEKVDDLMLPDKDKEKPIIVNKNGETEYDEYSMLEYIFDIY